MSCARLTAAVALLVACGASDALAQQVSRLVELIEAREADDHVDLVLQFGCSMRYAGHMPREKGTEARIRLRPGPDCGLSASGFVPTETPPLSGAEGLISAARLESHTPGELSLLLEWTQEETFFVAQGASTTGLRIRLVRRGTRTGRITVIPPGDKVSSHALNLESRKEPFVEADLQQASERLGTPAFVSEATLEGEKWYRLRVGPFERYALAEQKLRQAVRHYPRAWLAIGDDAVTSDAAALSESEPLPSVEPAGADPPLEEGERKALLESARRSLRARSYDEAIATLTKLQRQPEFAGRAQAQELLGLARERAGQLAHAKAEYEEYLRRYPRGEAAERVRLRLRILHAAAMPGRSGASSAEPEYGWRVSGGISQLYRHDRSELSTQSSTTRSTDQSALFNDADVLVRRRGYRTDLAFRANAGYTKDLLPEGPGDRTRVSSGYIEMVDRMLGLSGRIGRQSQVSDGVLGTFDGLALSWRFRPSWSLMASSGMPVESTRSGPDTERRFSTLALRFGPERAAWDLSVFATSQRHAGLRDRQAAGIELNYFTASRSLVALLDYDTSFSSLNAAVLIGTLQLPARWTVTLDAEHRNSPVLTTRNALIGQPVTSLPELRETFTDDEIHALAQDRTPVVSSYSVSMSRPISERFEISADLLGTRISGTAASGGIEAQPGTGTEMSYQVQLFANSLLRSGDFNAVALRYDTLSSGDAQSIAFMSRLPFAGGWRVSPRLRVDRRDAADQTRLWSCVPSLRIDYQRHRKLFELELGAELGQRDRALETDDSRRYFIGLGYRVGF